MACCTTCLPRDPVAPRIATLDMDRFTSKSSGWEKHGAGPLERNGLAMHGDGDSITPGRSMHSGRRLRQYTGKKRLAAKRMGFPSSGPGSHCRAASEPGVSGKPGGCMMDPRQIRTGVGQRGRAKQTGGSPRRVKWDNQRTALLRRGLPRPSRTTSFAT
jgi:hypothetical protein